MHETNLSLMSAGSNQLILWKEGGMIGGTGPMVLASSVVLSRRRGEERREWEENISLLSYGGRFSSTPGPEGVSYYTGPHSADKLRDKLF